MTVDEKRKQYEAQQQKALANRPKQSGGKMVKMDNAGLKELLQSKMDSLAQAIPQTAKKYLTPERIIKVVGMAVSRNPKLLECTGTSILIATMDSVSLGLEPGGPLEHAHLVPYWNGKTKEMEAKCIIGFKGYMDLARRSKEITSIACHLVYEGDLDTFDIDLATHSVKHRPSFFRKGGKSRGDWVGGYCLAKFINGDTQLEPMDRVDIEKIRDQVLNKIKKDWLKEQSPWTQHLEEMARKTIVRRAKKYWPLSVETQRSLAQADRINDASDGFIEETRTEIIDVTPKEEEAETPEPAQLPPADEPPDTPQPAESENPAPAEESENPAPTEQSKEEHDKDFDERFPRITSMKQCLDEANSVGMPDDTLKKIRKELGVSDGRKKYDEKQLTKLHDKISMWASDQALQGKDPGSAPEQQELAPGQPTSRVKNEDPEQVKFFRNLCRERYEYDRDEDIVLAMKGMRCLETSLPTPTSLDELTRDEIEGFLQIMDTRGGTDG